MVPISLLDAGEEVGGGLVGWDASREEAGVTVSGTAVDRCEWCSRLAVG